MKERLILVSLAALALGALGCEREEAFDGAEKAEETGEPKAAEPTAPEEPTFGAEGGEEMATATPVERLDEVEVELKTIREHLTHVEAEPLALSPEQTRRFREVKDRAMQSLEELEDRVGELKTIAEEAEKPKPGAGL